MNEREEIELLHWLNDSINLAGGLLEQDKITFPSSIHLVAWRETLINKLYNGEQRQTDKI